MASAKGSGCNGKKVNTIKSERNTKQNKNAEEGSYIDIKEKESIILVIILIIMNWKENLELK